MTIPGYDLDDLDEDLRAKLDRERVADYLTDEERQRLADGESLLDLLEEDDIDRLLAGEERSSE